MMGRKIKMKLYSMAGSPAEKPPWMKHKTFEKLKDRCFDYYETKYEKALYKELVAFYPNQRHLIEDYT